MAQIKISALPNITTPNTPVIFNPEHCMGCNTCVNVCQVDVFIPNPEKGNPPIILHPDECWYCGCCVMECPLFDQGAIRMKWHFTKNVGAALGVDTTTVRLKEYETEDYKAKFNYQISGVSAYLTLGF